MKAAVIEARGSRWMAVPGARLAYDTRWTWATLALGIVSAAPLWVGRFLPFADLPEHVATIATLHHWWDPVWNPRATFTLAIGHTQYLLYYVVGAALSFLLGTAERANLVLLSVIAIAFPFSLRSLLQAMHSDQRLAIFACPLFWTKPLLVGLLNYVAAIPFVLWGLAMAMRQAEEPRRRRAVLLAFAGVLIFYLHLSALAFFFGAALLCFLMVPAPNPEVGLTARFLTSRLRNIWSKLAWMLPAIALCAVWLMSSPVVRPRSAGLTEPLTVGFQMPDVALRHLPSALLDLWQGESGRWATLLFVGALLFLLWPSKKRVEDSISRSPRRAVAAMFLLAVALYFCMPYRIGWLWWLNARYAVIAALLLPAIARPPSGVRGTLSLGIAAGAVIWVTGSAALHVRAFQSEVDGFETVLEHAAPGRRLLAMIYLQESRVAKFTPFHHFGSYYRARLGGVAEYSFVDLPQSPLRYQSGAAPPPRPPGWEFDPASFRNDRDGSYFDYVLVRGGVDPFATNPTGPRWRLAAREGVWSLYGKIDSKAGLQ